MKSYSEEFSFTQFDEISMKYPDRIALIYLGEKYTYRTIKELTERFSSSLLRIGVNPHDKILLYIYNTPQWIIANYAINKIGATVVPVSPIYTSYEIEYIVRDSGIETAICMDTNFVYIKDLMEKTSLKRIIVTSFADLLPFWKRSLGYLIDKIPRGKVKRGINIYQFRNLIEEGKRPLPAIKIDPWKDLAYIMYTGGTTGFPKGVPGNHMGEVSYIRDIMEDILADHMREGKETIIVMNPLFHIMAKGYLIAFGLNFGNTVVLMPVPEIDPFLHAIQKYRVGWMLGVPALYRMILENDRLDHYDLSSLKYCYCGGDVLPSEVFNSWKKRFGIPIYQVYGSTEVGHVSYSPLHKDPDPSTVGVPLSSRKCLVADYESLKILQGEETGELLVTSKYIIKEYWRRSDETLRSYVRIGDEIYYRMGDLVKFRHDGEIRFIERIADIIKYKGYRISASEIEAVLQDHPAVIGACVIGVPDSSVGERIKAIVVLKEDARGVGSTDLIRWCRERLAPYKIPHYIEFRDMLPKSKVGKLLRREIRDEERRKMEKDQRIR